jgi:hypothetical protein
MVTTLSERLFGTVAKLNNSGLLESIKASFAIMQGAQYTKWQRQDDMVKGLLVRATWC